MCIFDHFCESLVEYISDKLVGAVEQYHSGGGTTLMCHGRDVHGWVRQLDVSPSTCLWSVEVYVSHGPHQGATVVFGYIEGSFLVSRTGDARERYAPNIYRFIHT